MIAQPAERISTVPSVKMPTSVQSGLPLDASHRAISVGHSSSKMPIGLSSRIRRKYKFSRFINAVSAVMNGAFEWNK